MLKALLLRSKINKKNEELKKLLAKGESLKTREAELEKAIAEAAEVEGDESKEADEALEAEIDSFNKEKEDLEAQKKSLEEDIAGLETELSEVEAEQEQTAAPVENPETPTENNEPETRERGGQNYMPKRSVRSVFRNMSTADRRAMLEREEVKNYLNGVRECIREKRAINGAELTIPEVFLGFLRENIEDYSKLYKYVNAKPINGVGRQVVQGAIPEAVWTECCANLNELDLGYFDAEFDCYKVGGFFDICNANLEDSDEDLAAQILLAAGQAIGLALDKAIIYGRNTADHSKMPLGIVSRLAQTSQPAGYPATARPWVDLHTTNILTIANTVVGIDLFKTLALDSAVIKGKYSASQKVWVMNETTRTFLMAQAMSVNAAGAIVSGIEGTMPVLGGKIEVEDFMPDYVIVGGHFDLYGLAERAGAKFASSEHVKFLQDRTVYKGTARYDGQPVIAEAFAAIGVNGVTPDADMTFASDNANTVMGIILDKSAATVQATKKVTIKATLFPDGVKGSITWASSDTTKATVADGVVTGVAAGSAVITATCGDAVAVCNVTVTS